MLTEVRRGVFKSGNLNAFQVAQQTLHLTVLFFRFWDTRCGRGSSLEAASCRRLGVADGHGCFSLSPPYQLKQRYEWQM